MTEMNDTAVTVDQKRNNMRIKNKGCYCLKNPDSLLKGSKLVAVIHVIGTIAMVAGLIYATINMDTVYKEVSQVNVNQLPYVIQNYIFPMKNNEIVEGQEAEKKVEEPIVDNTSDSFKVITRTTTKASAKKLNNSQSAKIDDDKKKVRKSKMNKNLFPMKSHTGESDGARRKRSNYKKSKKPMMSQTLATNVLIGIAIFHIIHFGLCVLLFLAVSKKKWNLMVPWMFSELFRQLIFLSLYGFIIYSSFPAITLTAVEDKIAKFQILFLVIILLIIVSSFVFWGVVIGALLNLYNRERKIDPKSDFLRNLFIGKFKKNSPTTINTIAEVPAASIIPKNEENSNLPAKPEVRTLELEEHYTIRNVGHAGGGGIWAW